MTSFLSYGCPSDFTWAHLPCEVLVTGSLKEVKIGKDKKRTRLLSGGHTPRRLTFSFRLRPRKHKRQFNPGFKKTVGNASFTSKGPCDGPVPCNLGNVSRQLLGVMSGTRILFTEVLKVLRLPRSRPVPVLGSPRSRDVSLRTESRLRQTSSRRWEKSSI